MDRIADWAWAAGLFEGEGCITMSIRDGRIVRPAMLLRMTDEEVVRRFVGVVGVGRVTGPNKTYKENHSPTYSWQISKWNEIAHVLIRMAPWLGARRRARGAQVMAHRPLDSWLPGYTRLLATHCQRGHELPGIGQNQCMECRREARREWMKTPAGRAWYERAKKRKQQRRHFFDRVS